MVWVGVIFLKWMKAGWTRIEGENQYYYHLTPLNDKGKRRKLTRNNHISEVIKHRGYSETIINSIIFSKIQRQEEVVEAAMEEEPGEKQVEEDEEIGEHKEKKKQQKEEDETKNIKEEEEGKKREP